MKALVFILVLLAESLCYGACNEYYLVMLVNARKLDTTSTKCFLRSVAKHPSDGSKNGDVGHAWILLVGDEVIEGGHSGELGEMQPRYMEGVLDNICLGARNPASYLFVSQVDGFFQRGNGGHMPTTAVKVDITKDDYDKIVAFIQSYPFHDYAIQGRQCASFVVEVAKLIAIDLEHQVTLPIDRYLCFHGEVFKMWEDEKYSTLTFSSPDLLEKSLKQLVKSGRGQDVLNWYLSFSRACFRCRMKKGYETLKRFPERYLRYLEWAY